MRQRYERHGVARSRQRRSYEPAPHLLLLFLDAALLTRYETFLRPKEFLWKDWVDGQQRKVKAGLDALEQEADSFGKGVDIGLITIGCALGYLDFRFAADEWRKGHPKLAAWHEGFSARPSMRETVPQG